MCIQIYLRYSSTQIVTFTTGVIRCLIISEPKYLIILKRMQQIWPYFQLMKKMRLNIVKVFGGATLKSMGIC